MVYLDGVYAGAMDVNHRYIPLEAQRIYQVWVYYYVGMHESTAGFLPKLVLIDTLEDQLYYDLYTPYEAIKLIDPKSETYITALSVLEQACNHIDWRKPGSDAYYDSIVKARVFLQHAFYEKLCGQSPVSVVCMGRCGRRARRCSVPS